MGAMRKLSASLPKITIGGQAIGMQTITKPVQQVVTQVSQTIGKPLEQAAAVAVSGFAATFGIPVTPEMVSQAATGIKKATYDKPSTPAATPAVVGTLGTSPVIYNSIDELYRGVLGREIENEFTRGYWTSRFGNSVDANELEIFKKAAEPELSGRIKPPIATTAAKSNAWKWVVGGGVGLGLAYVATRKR